MVFVTGPLCSGKRTFAQKLGGRQVYDVQDLAADAADLNRLADELEQRIRAGLTSVTECIAEDIRALAEGKEGKGE